MKHERHRRRASGGHLHSCPCGWERWATNERDLDVLWARHLPKDQKEGG